MFVVEDQDKELLERAIEILDMVDKEYPEDAVVYVDSLCEVIGREIEDPGTGATIFTICTAIESLLKYHEGATN